ncbi:MAG: hypothetical protein M4D80_14675 [Myxococcota bacterium]|nr:hypothetical protein [Myxococcota bacterium]
MRRLLFAAIIATASLAGCSKSEKADKAAIDHDLPEISIADVAAGLEAKQLTVVDCNSEKTRKKVGILPGAVLIDDETFTASELPSDKSTKLVFYCGGPG